MEKIDKETKDIIDVESKIEDFVESEGWSYVRKMLEEEILELQSVGNLDLTTDPTKLAIDVHGRNYASQILFGWLQKVEGTAQKSKDQKTVFKKKSFIVER